MRQRYTITIADIEMNVISDESPEAVEALVGLVDRKMREICAGSKRCSKSEAALLCALD
ncbi:MAG: cell division protein ZapA, partial [Clostridia bacterium]|nr:cell division protein ZapA [Clostridia bacterium]